eukprot:4763643-Pleurochrysis_carterae.AAC.1
MSVVEQGSERPGESPGAVKLKEPGPQTRCRAAGSHACRTSTPPPPLPPTLAMIHSQKPPFRRPQYCVHEQKEKARGSKQRDGHARTKRVSTPLLAVFLTATAAKRRRE